MRSSRVLLLTALASLLMMCFGILCMPKTEAVPASEMVTPPAVVGSPADAQEPAVNTLGPTKSSRTPMDTFASSEAISIWRRHDKNEIARYVDNLSVRDVEYLCFLLNLIPKDEVFDKVNVKGRLKRYLDGLQSPAEFPDVEVAFRQLERDRRRP